MHFFDLWQNCVFLLWNTIYGFFFVHLSIMKLKVRTFSFCGCALEEVFLLKSISNQVGGILLYKGIK